MKTHIVKVKRKHVALANNVDTCPLVNALNEATGDAWSVGIYSAYRGREVPAAKLPPKAVAFREYFDMEGKTATLRTFKPFAFKIKI